MKKLLALFLSICMLFCLMSCEIDDTSSSNVSQSETADRETEAPENDIQSYDTDETEANCPSGTKYPDYANDTLVWIPINGGKKYHSKSSCSGMKNPIQISKSEAINKGFGSCGRCY